jgi:hypothetical protein
MSSLKFSKILDATFRISLGICIVDIQVMFGMWIHQLITDCIFSRGFSATVRIVFWASVFVSFVASELSRKFPKSENHS